MKESSRTKQELVEELSILKKKIKKLENENAKRKLSEEALRESEVRSSTLSAATWEGIAIHKEGIIIDANKSAAKMFGYNVDEIIGKSAIDFLAPESIEAALQKIKEGISHDELRLEVNGLRKDKTCFPVELLGRSIRHNNIDQRVFAFRDITERKQAEKTLRESEEKYRLLIENSHDIIYTLTADGLFTYVSPTWTLLLGHPVSQVNGHSFAPFVHQDDLAGCMVWLQKGIETGQRQDGVEYRVRHIDGSWRWHTSSGVPLRDEAGTVVGFYGTARDISDRKVAEEKLLKIMYEQQIILDNANIGISMIKDRRMIWVNLKIEDMFQYSKEELEGQSTRKFYPSNEAYEQLVRDANLALGKGQIYKTEQKLVRRDGTPILVRYNGKAIEPTDLSKGTIWLLEDITEFKHAEEYLRESETKFRTIFDSFEDIYYETDLSGIITLISPSVQRLSGWTPEELIGQPATLVYDAPEDRSALLTAIISSGYVRDYELQLLKRDGSKVAASLAAHLIYDSSGAPAGLAGALRDISDRKRAEEALSAAEESYRNIFLNSQTGLFRTDIKTGMVLEANDSMAKFAGYKNREELLFSKFNIAERYTDPEARQKMLALIKEHGEVGNSETQFRRNDGSVIWIRLSAKIIPEKGCLEGVAEDITDSKRAQEALRESE